MHFYGYEKGNIDSETPLELDEIAIRATPEVLKRIAQFILKTSENMEEHGDRFGHEHFKDFIRKYEKTWEGPDIIISS